MSITNCSRINKIIKRNLPRQPPWSAFSSKSEYHDSLSAHASKPKWLRLAFSRPRYSRLRGREQEQKGVKEEKREKQGLKWWMIISRSKMLPTSVFSERFNSKLSLVFFFKNKCQMDIMSVTMNLRRTTSKSRSIRHILISLYLPNTHILQLRCCVLIIIHSSHLDQWWKRGVLNWYEHWYEHKNCYILSIYVLNKYLMLYLLSILVQNCWSLELKI